MNNDKPSLEATNIYFYFVLILNQIIPIKSIVKNCKDQKSTKEKVSGSILSGELDGLPEQAFYLVGNIDEATAKATNLEMESKLKK